MTSPSQPLSIKSPTRGRGDGESQSASYATSFGTPDLRAIRAQFSGLPPNIPVRGSVTPSLRPASSVVSLQVTPDRPAFRPTPQLIAGLSATRQPVGTTSETPPIADLDDLPAEEKAKVLERHLVYKEQRVKANTEAKSAEDSASDGAPGSHSRPTPSRRSSTGISTRQQDDTFPINYDAPGADVT